MKKSFNLFDSDSLKDFHKRIFFSMLLFVFVYSVAVFRIVDIMVFSIDDIQIKSTQLDYQRGKIYDKNGNLLATSIISNSLSTNPLKIKNKTLISKNLSEILNLDENKILKNLNKSKKFVWIKRNITPKEHQAIINLGEINLRIHKETKRVYPYSNFASHLVGYVDIDGIGRSGIERAFEKTMLDDAAAQRRRVIAGADSMATPSMLRRFDGQSLAKSPFGGMANFKMLKRGARGRPEARELHVPETTNFAAQVRRNKEARDAEDRSLKEATYKLAARQDEDPDYSRGPPQQRNLGRRW